MKENFGKYHSTAGSGYYRGTSRSGYYTLDDDALYDFLFDNDFDGWFCNNARTTRSTSPEKKIAELKNVFPSTDVFLK